MWQSFFRNLATPFMPTTSPFTMANYAFVLHYPIFVEAVRTSVLLGAMSATFVVLLTFAAAWVTQRGAVRGGWVLDALAFSPIAIPSVIIGASVLFAYLMMPLPFYNTIWILLIAYVTRFMPYGMRYATTSLLQLHRELEECAAMCGASWQVSFRRVVLPLLKPGLMAGWIYIVIVSVRELSSSILLYSPGTEVLSIVIWELWQNGQYVELSALGVMLITALLAFVLIAQAISRSFGVREV